MAASTTHHHQYLIAGYSGCGYYHEAIKQANENNIQINIKEFADRKSFKKYINTDEIRESIGLKHHTSPVIWEIKDNITSTFVGGSNDFLEHLNIKPTTTLAEDRSSMNHMEVFDYFNKMQKNHKFVIWVLWRGIW